MVQDDTLAEHDLALGGTRPALFPYLGMPWRDFIVFLIVGMECAVVRWQFLILLAFPFVGSIFLYRKDYNAGRCFVAWLSTSGRHLGAATLGGTFVSPAPAYPQCIFRGMP
jgi:hypothetical protein